MIRILILATTLVATGVHAQGWKPERNVAIVVANSPGGSNDRTARQIESFLTSRKLINTSMSIINKPGGGGTIAYTYVNERAGDPHMLLIGTPALLLSYIVGLSSLTHKDFTPVASLFNDYYVFAVAANSPMRTGKDLIERLKKDPQSVGIGYPTAVSINLVAAALLMKSIGGQPKAMKGVVFKGTSEAITAMLGNHLEMIITPAGNINSHLAAGRMRGLGVTSPQRLGGPFAAVPTWREQGIDLVVGGWRAVLAPKGITAAQLAYWEGLLKKATESPDWKADLEKNDWTDAFTGSAQFRKELDKEFIAMSAVMKDVGLAKAPAK